METINELIKESGLTQKYISAKLGVSEKHFSMYVKSNYGKLEISKFSLLAEILNVRMEDLYNIWENERK